MGILPRMVAAFVIVIAMMVAGYSIFDLYLDFRNSRLEAFNRVENAKVKLIRDLTAAKAACDEFSSVLINKDSLMRAFLSKNRSQTAKQLQATLNQNRFPGFVTLIDANGKVFYSSETPNKHGYSASSESKAIQNVLQKGEVYRGPSDFSKTKSVTVSAIVPVNLSNGQLRGLLVVSQPLNNEYLTGELGKFSMEEINPVEKVDLAVFSSRSKKVSAATKGLRGNNRSQFLKALNENGERAFPGSMFGMGVPFVGNLLVPIDSKRVAGSFETDGRWWFKLPLTSKSNTNPNGVEHGILLISTPVPNIFGKLLIVLISAGAFGGISLFFAFVFSSRISSSVNEPLHFLIDRTSDIADRRANIEPLEGLSGDWLELGEIIDTAVSTMRSTTQNLKLKLNRQKEELVESKQIADESTAQISNLNKTITTQSRQITEVSKQINQANRQAIVVQHKLDAVLQSSTEGFLLLDQYGNVLASNPVFLNWSGCTEGEIAGRQCFDLVRKPGEPRGRITGQAFAKHGGDPNAVINRFHPECIVYHAKKDKHIEAIAHMQPIVGEDNSVQGYVMVLRDKSLRSENAKLREEIITMLQDSIRGPIAEAESRWASVLSNANKSVHPQIVTSLTELHDIYQKLLAVVDSYLMMYGGFVPEPVIPKEPIIISRLVADCLEEVTPHARKRQLLLEHKTVPGLPTMHGNKELVRGALVEVLNKLVAITAAGGRVRVESSVKDQQMRLSVTSSGPALPPEEITDMFAGYIEGKHSQDTYAERLSLYLARNNVERIGGQIWAESESGRGTAIYIGIPSRS